MRALVIGGGACVWDDLAALKALIGCWTGTVLAVNDVGADYPGRIDHWCSLHPEKFHLWRPKRLGNADYVTWAHPGHGVADQVMSTTDDWSGSSGLFAVKVALETGHDRIVLCGVPMDTRPHYFDGSPWVEQDAFAPAWRIRADQLRDKVKSMSGWTRTLLGAPAPDWLDQ